MNFKILHLKSFLLPFIMILWKVNYSIQREACLLINFQIFQLVLKLFSAMVDTLLRLVCLPIFLLLIQHLLLNFMICVAFFLFVKVIHFFELFLDHFFLN